jgi:hypothetical protein
MKGGGFLLGERPKIGDDLIIPMKKGPKLSGSMAVFGGKPQHKRAGMNPAPTYRFAAVSQGRALCPP